MDGWTVRFYESTERLVRYWVIYMCRRAGCDYRSANTAFISSFKLKYWSTPCLRKTSCTWCWKNSTLRSVFRKVGVRSANIVSNSAVMVGPFLSFKGIANAYFENTSTGVCSDIRRWRVFASQLDQLEIGRWSLSQASYASETLIFRIALRNV